MFVNHWNGYKLIWSVLAIRDLNGVERKYVIRIKNKLENLVAGHQNLDIKKLVGFKKSRYRLRVGSYRIVFEVCDDQIIIIIIEVKPRDKVYKGRK